MLAHAVEELLPHCRVVAVAHRGHEVAAIAAEVLHGPLPSDVPLIRHEDEEHEDEEADDHAYREALEAPVRGLEREGGAGEAHGPAWRVRGKKGWSRKTRLNR